MSQIVVAVDGPAGSGKSSVSKAAALQLGFDYLDTGAGYRAFTLHAIENPDTSIQDLLGSFSYEISLDPSSQEVQLSGRDVTDVIRTQDVASRVSEFARLDEVRQLQLVDARARIAASSAAGIVVEGRDITTVVAPDAQVRVLLTASHEARLARRALEKSEDAANIERRDLSDSQVVDFFNPAPGVILLDTTELSFSESVSALVKLIEEGSHG